MGEETQPLEADEALVTGAQAKLAESREAKLLVSLLTQLRERDRPWWSPRVLRDVWPTSLRLKWLAQRPDVRGHLTHQLTGLAPLAAREAAIELQASLIDMVVEAGDLSVEDWETAFEIEDIAIHGPASVLWQEFRSRYPWDEPEPEDRELLVWLLVELLDERKEGSRTSSIMTPLYVRSAIDVRVWQEHIPLDIRVQVDGRRLRKELEGKSFTCRDELAVVKIERIVEHIPAPYLTGILDALERVLPALAQTGNLQPGDDEPERTESVPRGSQGSETH